MRLRRRDSDKCSSEAQPERSHGFDGMMARQVFEEDTTACHSEVDSSRLGSFAKAGRNGLT